MSMAGAIRRIALGSIALLLGGCVGMGDVPTRDEFMRVPREIRTGAAQSVIERVESTVNRAEIAAAVQTIVTAAPPGVQSGALRSLCLDDSRQVVGDDLNLNAQ